MLALRHQTPVNPVAKKESYSSTRDTVVFKLTYTQQRESWMSDKQASREKGRGDGGTEALRSRSGEGSTEGKSSFTAGTLKLSNMMHRVLQLNTSWFVL